MAPRHVLATIVLLGSGAASAAGITDSSPHKPRRVKLPPAGGHVMILKVPPAYWP